MINTEGDGAIFYLGQSLPIEVLKNWGQYRVWIPPAAVSYHVEFQESDAFGQVLASKISVELEQNNM